MRKPRAPRISSLIFGISAAAWIAVLRPDSAFAPTQTSAPENSAAAGDHDSFELISDVDLTFLIGNPKTSWGPDLFRKSPGFAAVDPAAAKPQIQGIVYQGRQSTAFIDNRSVSVGDRLGDRQVVEIGPNFVVLEDGDSQIELVLPPARKKNRRIAADRDKDSP